MTNINVKKYMNIVAHGINKDAKMISELRMLLENCQMPYKTYATLAPFLQEDISQIDTEQLESFAFFFLSALMKGR